MIGQTPLDPSHFPADQGVTLSPARWKEFDLQAACWREQFEGVEYLERVVQVPLSPRAIQVAVAGPASREIDIRAAMGDFLARLQGRSNWDGASAPRPATALELRRNAEAYGYFMLGVMAVAFIVGLVVIWAVRPFLPRGGVLAIAAGLFAIGCMIPDRGSRELLMASGGLRLFSITAAVIGLFDACRPRKKKVPLQDDRGWGDLPPGPGGGT